MFLQKLPGMLAAFCVLLLLASGCGPVPTDPDDDTGSDERIYRNEQWGFQVTVPASTWDWSLNVQTHLLWVDVNGLPKVEVRMQKPPADGLDFRPLLFLEPRALTQDTPLDTLVTFLEKEFQERFTGYSMMGDKKTIQVASEKAAEWSFSTHPIQEFGDHFLAERFLATVVVHNRQVYVVLGNGTREDFPLSGFRDILSNLVFLE